MGRRVQRMSFVPKNFFFISMKKKKEYSEWNMLGMQIKWAGVARPIVHLIPNHWPSFPLRHGHMAHGQTSRTNRTHLPPPGISPAGHRLAHHAHRPN
ncbi:hypothetical protein SORBI_3005G139750 [Sorghum bicolor]|uniref:Uncharacterized protein n=1 Tax=Sorghum bicolor TaxID=4558 RepID=A0A1Z5RJQ5_SORBI|nr:hypothetical protein SORBI_3005G139750 [Sorghum bicolor]